MDPLSETLLLEEDLKNFGVGIWLDGKGGDNKIVKSSTPKIY